MGETNFKGGSWVVEGDYQVTLVLRLFKKTGGALHSRDDPNSPGLSECGILVASSQQWRGFWGFREAMRGKISKTFSLFRRTRPSSYPSPSRQLASTAAFDAWQ